VVVLRHFECLFEQVAAVVLPSFRGVDEAHVLQSHCLALLVANLFCEVHLLLQLHLVALVVAHVEVLLPDVSQVADSNGFAHLAAEKVSLLECELLVHGGLVLLLHARLDLAQVDVGDELTRLVGNLPVQVVEFDRPFAQVGVTVPLHHHLLVHAYAVLSERLPVGVLDLLADRQELVLVVDGFFLVQDVVADDADREVGASFVLLLAGTVAGERKHFVVLDAALAVEGILTVEVAEL